MYYIRYPLSFRQFEDILHERGIDICHETVRFWVNRFGAKFAKEILRRGWGATQLAVASGWSFRQNQRWKILPLARRWSWRRSSWMLCYRTMQQGCSEEVPYKRNAKARITKDYCNRQVAILRRGFSWDWNCWQAIMRRPVQQQMRKFAPAISTTRTSDAAFQDGCGTSEICQLSRPDIQPLQSWKTSRKQTDL